MTSQFSNSKLYLPPAAVTKIRPTDSYITRTSVFYHAQSERLLTVGHPYYATKRDSNVDVPKVSPHQYRVFRIRLPDPNRLALADTSLFNPEKERLVWGCRGLEVGRGQPLGVALSGNPLLNRFTDTENPSKYSEQKSSDNRQNVSFDAKQTQLIMLGCKPAIGEHWKRAKQACPEVPEGGCPPLELQNSHIEDGDMGDIGFGAMDFGDLQASKSEVPLDIVDSICKYPDFLKMANDTYGDFSFFFIRREQMYQRHFFSRAGKMGDPVPGPLTQPPEESQQPQNNISSSVYFGTPSGSLVTSESQIFNRPYWLQRAQGPNNGIAWHNQLFITVMDNTRGTNFTVTVPSANSDSQPGKYKQDKYTVYTRHVEEYELSLILQLCKVPLNPEVLTHIHAMDQSILDEWNLGVNPPAATILEDQYRFIQSTATKCPPVPDPQTDPDPYTLLSFWTLDFTDRISPELDQFPLGRKFLFQAGTRVPRKRPLPPSKPPKQRPTKRKRK
ncbi:L1 [Trichechus manatus latirostris papillomavirus 3]|uniref:Major capsid protein L1 n=1 Tax=Trichechus manatus latirostris papillomavirus 3 TaxID=2848316 RepID=V5TG08_9PAPI|nr:L1 [Trichechus manatus latirostris papillomavirus 3]AHB63944.1 major capsid protein [Trichechus manatus latirostris papillomavirus 3]AKE50901.1 L1 [Trichechus manatus latirostris papillomavirus 3]